MCAYQEPEVYVKQFVECALTGIGDVQLFEEMKVPHIRLKADYGVENIVIEAEAPCGRAKGREQVKEYMRRFNRVFGVVIDVPIERYFTEYPKPCWDRVGFELYMRFGDRIDAVYLREFEIHKGREQEAINMALNEFRSIIELLRKLQLSLIVAKSKPTPEYIIMRVNELIEKHDKLLKDVLAGSHERARLYFNTWIRTMDLVYGREVIEEISKDALSDLFIKLTIYVTLLKSLGATLLEATLGGGRYTIPLRLYLEGSTVATRLFWLGEALAQFNVTYLFERDEYDWVFDPSIAPKLDAFFRELGAFLLSIDWSQEVGLDLLKRVYQNIVPREIRRQLGEFYTPDWIAQLIIWRALHILIKGSPPQEAIVPDPIDRAVGLIDEFYKKHERIPRFIDPTCGSFTFGVHYVNALLRWYNTKRVPIHPVEFARMIMDSVMGIDLNPVAVITAKVNYLLQIFRLLTIYGGFLAEQPVIPILRLDLLSLHLSGFDETKKTLDAYIVLKKPEEITLKILLEILGVEVTEELEEWLKKRGVSIVTQSTKYENKAKTFHYIELRLPLSISRKAKSNIAFLRALMALLNSGIKGFENELGIELDKNEREALTLFRNAVVVLEERGLDTIWYSIVSNYVLATYIMQQKFDLVLGNLPWVNVSKYPEIYADFVKEITKELGVSLPPQALKKLDISVPLFAIALKHLAGSESVTALMVQASIFRGLHGAGWRSYISTKPYSVIEIWDLSSVEPFEGAKNQPGIAFVANGITAQSFKILRVLGKKLSPDYLGKEPDIDAVYMYLNNNVLSIERTDIVQVQFVDGIHWLTKGTYEYAKRILGRSPYEAHEGASLTGEKGTRIVVNATSVGVPVGGLKNEKYVLIETELSKSLGLPPFVVEEKFLFKGIKGEDIEVGRIKTYKLFVLPYYKNGKPLSENELKQTLLWRNYLSNPKVVNVLISVSAHLKESYWYVERLNEKALSQYKVVWRDGAETFIPAIDTTSAIPDYTVNYIPVSSFEEACYLLAVLLAPQINAVVKELVSWIGHVRPRFIKYFKIPRYNPRNEVHRRLTEIGKAIYNGGEDTLKDVLKEIEELVERL